MDFFCPPRSLIGPPSPFINFCMQPFISFISSALCSCRCEISIKFLLNEEVALYKSFIIEKKYEKIYIGVTDVHNYNKPAHFKNTTIHYNMVIIVILLSIVIRRKSPLTPKKNPRVIFQIFHVSNPAPPTRTPSHLFIF